MSFISMADGEDWIMRPVLRRMCLYESLKDGSLDLEDIARMNEALDVQSENEDRYREAQQQ